MAFLAAVGRFAARYFTWIVLFASAVAWWRPGTFEIVVPRIGLLLGIVMFGMGATLRLGDFRGVLRQPREVAIGVGAQYLIMPLLGWLLAVLFRLPPELAAGVILVGACPGGTASNVITFIARGDVALSVTLTAVSTVLAPLLTPLLMLVFAGQWLLVDPSGLFSSILQIVLLPVVLGLLVRRYLARLAEMALPVLPLISIFAIALIVGAVVGANAEALGRIGFAILLVVVLHNLLGFLCAWLIGGAARLSEPQRKAVTVEVGMQNSGLAVALASIHLGPLAAIPGAVFSVWHNLSGSVLANWWNRRGNGNPEASDREKPVACEKSS